MGKKSKQEKKAHKRSIIVGRIIKTCDKQMDDISDAINNPRFAHLLPQLRESFALVQNARKKLWEAIQ